jgi:hypothetical protein
LVSDNPVLQADDTHGREVENVDGQRIADESSPKLQSNHVASLSQGLPLAAEQARRLLRGVNDRDWEGFTVGI